MKRLRLAPLALLALVPAVTWGTPPGVDMAVAAGAWLQSLTPGQREQAVFPIDAAERENWHYIPRARKGVTLGSMTESQRGLARQLLGAGLSQRGQLQVEAIIALENVLAAMEESTRRNPQLYYFSVFGAPAADGAWGWRVEGHHLSINFTLAAGRVSATPLFFGADPAEVRIAHAQKGRRALAQEEDLGRALVKSLDANQRQAAVISPRAPSDIFTAANRAAKPLEPAGLASAQMMPAQQAQLRALVELYAGRLRAEMADTELQKIATQGWGRVFFAWAGGLEPGEGNYYRIQGPAFVIEYDNTQDDANHIHTAWRKFEGDFGRDLLREHYQRGHSGAH